MPETNILDVLEYIGNNLNPEQQVFLSGWLNNRIDNGYHTVNAKPLSVNGNPMTQPEEGLLCH